MNLTRRLLLLSSCSILSTAGCAFPRRSQPVGESGSWSSTANVTEGSTRENTSTTAGPPENESEPRPENVTTVEPSSTASSEADIEIQFDRKVRAVADLGMDPTGNSPIDDILETAIRERTLIEFEPGIYQTNRQHVVQSIENWGIRGLGSSSADVRIRPPNGDWLYFLNVKSGRNILVENLTFDMLQTWEGAIGNVFNIEDGLYVKNVEYAGKHPNQHTGTATLLVIRVSDEDGLALVDGFIKKGATELTQFPNNAITLFSGAGSEGTLHIRNSHFENSGEHGAYVSHTDGPVHIENCYFKNNQNSHARISGSDSWVRDSKFVWDISDHPNKGDFQSQTGLVWEAGNTAKESGGSVENCVFICKSSVANSGCLKIDGSQGSVEVRKCRFRVNEDSVVPLIAEPPGHSHMISGLPVKPWEILIEDIHISGHGAAHRKKPGAINLLGRDGSAIRGVCIEMNGSRSGFYLSDGSYSVKDTSINVGSTPIITANADVTKSNVMLNGGSCRSND